MNGARRRKGFTLIELLVVVSIIGLLTSIVLGALVSARTRAQIIASQSFAGTMDHSMGDAASGWWDFNECSGSTVGDRSPYGNAGATVNMTSANWSSSNMPFGQGCSLSFNGSNQSVSIPDSSSLDISSKVTLASWVYATQASGIQDVISKSACGGSGANTGYIFPRTDDGWTNAVFYLHVSGGWNTVNAPYGSSKMNQWHFLTATYDGSNMKIYIDGSLVATKPQTGSITTNSNALSFGTQPGCGEYFGGSMARARVYSSAITADRVREIYAAEAPAYEVALKK